MNSVATLGSGHCGAIWGSCLSFRWLRHTRAADGGRSQARTFGARTNFKIATGIRTIQNVFRDHHHETQNNVQFFSNQSRQMLFLCFVVMKIDPKNHETQNNVQFFSNQSPKMPFLCFVFPRNTKQCAVFLEPEPANALFVFRGHENRPKKSRKTKQCAVFLEPEPENALFVFCFSSK